MKIEVAVLGNYPHLLRKYVLDHCKANENYTFIRDIEMSKGKVFGKIVYTVDWHDMDDFVDVQKEVLRRLKK